MAIAWRNNLSVVSGSGRQRITLTAVASVDTQSRQSSMDKGEKFTGVKSSSTLARLSAHHLETMSDSRAKFRRQSSERRKDSKNEHSVLEHDESESGTPATEAWHRMDRFERFEHVPDDVIKEFEAKLEGDLQSVFATLFAGIGVITWWRGVWALLDHYVGDSVFGHIMCVITGLMIILYIRFSGYKLTNFFPPS